VLDSFSTLSLTAFLDENFHVQLEPAEVNPENLRNVNAITRIVLARLASSPTAPASS